MKTLKIFSLALLAGVIFPVYSAAQSKAVRTVTNTDLEKYREARVKADEDYRQNYARLGRPSPEELERWEAERQKRLTELSRQVQTQRRQEEYFQLLKALAAANDEPQISYLQSRSEVYQFGYAPFVFRGGRSHFFRTRTGFGPNVQLVRDQASMFPGALQLINRNRAGLGRNVFRGGFRTPNPRPVFLPRR